MQQGQRRPLALPVYIAIASLLAWTATQECQQNVFTLQESKVQDLLHRILTKYDVPKEFHDPPALCITSLSIHDPISYLYVVT